MNLDLQGKPWLREFTQSPWKHKLKFMGVQNISSINPCLKFANIHKRKLSNTQNFKLAQKVSLITQPPYFEAVDCVAAWKVKPFKYSSKANSEKIKLKVKYTYSDLVVFYFLATTQYRPEFRYSFVYEFVSQFKWRYGTRFKLSIDSKNKVAALFEKKIASNWSLRLCSICKLQNFTREQLSFGFGISYSYDSRKYDNQRQIREITDYKGDQIVQIKEAL